MQNTINYNLKKPDYTDFADIQDINDNMDKIDEELAAPTGDSADSTATFTCSDVADGDAAAWTNVPALTSGETHKSIFAKMSQMFKNLRYLYKLLGTTDISNIGNGTVTNALSVLNANGVKTISRSGTTFTATRHDGSTFTFDQQDNNTTYGLATTSANGLLRQLNGKTSYYMRGDGTWQIPPNTWRGIQNVLTSTSTTDSLSAAMGKALKDQIGNLGAVAKSDPYWRFALPGGYYLLFGARIYTGIAIDQVYGSAFFYNFTCSMNGLVPNNILMIQATANCNGGVYSVSIATSNKERITGFIWAPMKETSRSVALNLFIICN